MIDNNNPVWNNDILRILHRYDDIIMQIVYGLNILFKYIYIFLLS